MHRKKRALKRFGALPRHAGRCSEWARQAIGQFRKLDQRTGAIDYGLTVGAVVVPQRHRYVGGDPNWDPRMGRFLGQEARVTRLSGIDGQGCPGIRLDIDGGQYFWRVRDLDIGVARPRGVLARLDRVPDACGGGYGAIAVGARVVLGRHRPVGGEDNWSSTMAAYVGRTARVVALVGADEQGCPGAHIDLDGGEWFWRVRDMHLLGEGEEGVAFAPGTSVLSTVPELEGGVQPGSRHDLYGRRRATIDPDDFTGGFAIWSGTSFAAPYVAGLIARELAPVLMAGTAGGVNATAAATDAALKVLERIDKSPIE